MVGRGQRTQPAPLSRPQRPSQHINTPPSEDRQTPPAGANACRSCCLLPRPMPESLGSAAACCMPSQLLLTTPGEDTSDAVDQTGLIRHEHRDGVLLLALLQRLGLVHVHIVANLQGKAWRRSAMWTGSAEQDRPKSTIAVLLPLQLHRERRGPVQQARLDGLGPVCAELRWQMNQHGRLPNVMTLMDSLEATKSAWLGQGTAMPWRAGACTRGRAAGPWALRCPAKIDLKSHRRKKQAFNWQGSTAKVSRAGKAT